MRRVLFILGLTMFLIWGCGEESNHKPYSAVVEGTLIEVPALVGGKLVSKRVETGDQVSAGDTLALIDTTELVLQKQQLLASLEQVKIQQDITRTALERAQADLQYVRDNYERTKTLVESQSVPKQTLDDLANKLQNVESAAQTARKQVQSARSQQQVVQAQLASVSKKLHDAVILAPRSGIISETYFEQAEAVPPMQPVVELVQLDVVETKIYVSETTLPHIRIGQSARINIDGSEETLDGKIIWISPKAEFTPKQVLTPETRTSLVYAVKVQIDNKNQQLKHGMPVEVVL